MPFFYFQQHTSRSDYGWLDGMNSIPSDWIKDFTKAVQRSQVMTNRGSRLQYHGGVYISPKKQMLTIFSLNPAPSVYADKQNRRDHVVLNALFIGMEKIANGKSLKQVWKHPILKIPPQNTADEQIFIQLDEDMGESESEKIFFSLSSSHYDNEVMVVYPNNGTQPHLIEFSRRSPHPQEPVVEEPNGNILKKLGNFLMKDKFLLGIVSGVIIGAVIVGAVILYLLRPAPALPPPEQNTLELQIEQLPQNVQFYEVSFRVNVIHEGKNVTRLVFTKPSISFPNEVISERDSVKSNMKKMKESIEIRSSFKK